MKCPRCHALNSDFDADCGGCHQPLVRVNTIPTPQWAYFFAVGCGAIPIIALGGLIPAALGIGGAGGCLKISRLGSLPTVVRLLACAGIMAGCWLLFVLLVMAVMAKPR